MLSSSSNDTRSPRQKLGSACEECRKRKLQCDRQLPQCRVCSESNVECEFPAVQRPRGPKKGHLRALKSKIAELEQRLAEPQFERYPNEECSNLAEGVALSMEIRDKEPPTPYSLAISEAETEDGTPVRHFSYKMRDQQAIFPSAVISDMIRADLDQSYFERAHMFAPILHRSRYFTWTQKTAKSESQICLQYTMWTLASSLSAPFQEIHHSLYKDARKMLENLEMKETKTEDVDIEQAQAWILIAIYEFMRTNYRQGWTSIGRAFRLVQLMRLFEMDNSDGFCGKYGNMTHAELVAVEEKRRTFWTSYVFDRFVSIRNEWPLTLNEQVISTRLPVPELEFQRNILIPMPFLSEVIATGSYSILSGFTECIVLATILGRSISYKQQSNVENVYGSGVSEKFWDWHQWLDSILTERIEILELHYPSPLEHVDSMHLFTHMMAQTTIIYLFKIIDSTSWKASHIQYEVLQYRQRAVLAAQQIVVLAKALSQLGHFKVNPFTPIPLFICAEFLITHEHLDKSFDSYLRGIMDVLQNLQSVNNLANNYLSLLKAQADRDLSKSSGRPSCGL